MADKPGSLRIAVGVGRTYEVPAAAAAEFAGKDVRTALKALCEKHIKDPELKAEFGTLLSEPRLALDLYAGDQETPLSLQDSWDERILNALSESQDAELGVARAHSGGAKHRGSPGGAGSPGTPVWTGRLLEQPSESLAADYQLTDEDRTAASQGKKLFISGRVLAMVEEVCREMGADEALWYYLTRGPEPVIRELYLPVQQVTCCSCQVDGQEVIRAGREIRRKGCSVYAAGHSHGHSVVFSSHTDWNEARTLLLETAGRRSVVSERVGGRNVRKVETAAGAAAVRADLPDGSISVEISSPGTGLGEDLEVTFVRTLRQATSVFSTSNVRGDHIFPVLEARYCWQCGAKEERDLSPAGLTVCVLGPVEMTAEDKKLLRTELDKKIRKGWGASYWPAWQGGPAVQPQTQVSGFQQPMAEPAASPCAPYTLWRGPALLASIEPAVLEEAASKTPALRQALGWEEPRAADEAAHETQEDPGGSGRSPDAV